MFYQNDLALRKSADVAGGKPIAVHLGVSAGNPLVVFYDINGRIVLFFLVCLRHHTRL
jgi:hypothetical protein